MRQETSKSSLKHMRDEGEATIHIFIASTILPKINDYLFDAILTIQRVISLLFLMCQSVNMSSRGPPTSSYTKPSTAIRSLLTL